MPACRPGIEERIGGGGGGGEKGAKILVVADRNRFRQIFRPRNGDPASERKKREIALALDNARTA